MSAIILVVLALAATLGIVTTYYHISSPMISTNVKNNEPEITMINSETDPENVDVLNILLAGYGWYWSIPPGQKNNAQIVAEALNGTVIEGAKVYAIVMPVTWYGALQPVVKAIDEIDPEIVLGIGTSPRSPGLRWEKYGCNYMTSYHDSAFPVPVSVEHLRPIDPNGPELQEVSFPVEIAAAADLEAGIPAKVGSYYVKDDRKISTAGTYLCNYFTYTIPRYVELKGLDILAGFVHIPQRSLYAAMDYAQGRVEDLYPNMPIETIIEGVKIGLKEVIRRVYGPANFRFSDLTITPSEPVLGKPVKISVTVTNLSPGNFARVAVVKLLVFNEVKAVKEVTLKPGESKTVTFEIIPDSPATYLINVGGLIKTFTPKMPEKIPAEELLSG